MEITVAVELIIGDRSADKNPHKQHKYLYRYAVSQGLYFIITFSEEYSHILYSFGCVSNLRKKIAIHISSETWQILFDNYKQKKNIVWSDPFTNLRVYVKQKPS